MLAKAATKETRGNRSAGKRPEMSPAFGTYWAGQAVADVLELQRSIEGTWQT
jgi:hypothetical protein